MSAPTTLAQDARGRDFRIVADIARLMDCDCRVVEEREEHKDPLRYRLFKAFMRGSFEGSQNAPRLKMVDADCIRAAAERVVTAAAKNGNAVIVGRGSAYYLRERPDTFHVFIYGPFAEKVQRLRKKGHSEEEAVELVETVDRDRAAYIRQYFDVEWPARYLFDLMINSKVGLEAVVQTILQRVSVSNEASRKAPAGTSPASR